MILAAFITLSALAARAEIGAIAEAKPSVAPASPPPVAADVPTTATSAPLPAPMPVATPIPSIAVPVEAPPNLQNDLQRLQNEYLETKNAGFGRWRDNDVTAVGALLDAIASRFADALAHRQNLTVTGLATRTTIPGWGKPMEVSARSFVELGEGTNAKIVCKLDTNLGYFFFPAMVNVECLWLGSSERLQLNGLATSSQPVASADPSSLGGIDLNKLELRFPDDPKADRLQ